MDRKIEELQDDVKVLKNEIKQTLVDVRDYLLTNADEPLPSNPAQQDIPGPGAETHRPAAVTEAIMVPPDRTDGHDGVRTPAPPPVADVTREAPSDTNGLLAGKTNGATPHPTNGSTPHPGSGATASLMVTVATLAAWLEDGLRSIGGTRLRTIVELHASHGRLPGQFKDVLLQLISLETCEKAREEVPLQECLRVLAELENVASRSRSDPDGAAVLSMILHGTNLFSGSQVRPKTADERGIEGRFREWLELQISNSEAVPPDDSPPHKKTNGASARRRE